MPLERLREQFMSEAQMFYPLGRNQQSARPKPKSGEQPPAISTTSTSSTSSKASTNVVPGAYVRRTRPIVLSSDEEDEETEEESDDAQDLSSEIEILPNPPNTKPRSPPKHTNITKSTTQPPNTTPTIRSLPPYNRTRPELVGYVSQGSYKTPSNPPRFPANPIHIPSNKDLPKPGPTMMTFDHDRHNTSPPMANQAIYIHTADHSSGANEIMTSTEAEKALKDLISGNMNEETEQEIDPDEKIVKGFKDGITLMDHQVIGKKWMAEREDTKAKKRGGILADDMGLGKTIQTLTTIVGNKATRSDVEDGWSCSTLVVCPLALVGQWAEEIKKMTKLSVLKHQGTSRTIDPAVLRRHDVVVTTYDTVKSEYASFVPEAKDESKSKKAKSKKQSQVPDDSDSESDEAEHFGRTISPPTRKSKLKDAIFQVKWFRVVLDEAHNIKNHTTKGAIACCALQSKYAWCLTGTPLQNNVIELYSLFKFLGVRPYHELDAFKTHFAQPIQSGRGAGRAMGKLQVVLKTVMLRRRKDDKLNGKKLIDLPKRTVEIVSCPFDSSERNFYSSLETKMGDVLEELMNQEGNKYMSVLLLLLRLRQACNHPLLVTKDYKKDFEAVESQASRTGSEADANDLLAAFSQMGITRKCQMCTMDIGPRNAGEGRWSGHCRACIPLAEQALLAERERPSSAKIRKILELLKGIDERSGSTEKTIIFSQFTSMLDLIEPFLKEKGIRFVRYDGSMAPVDREASLAKIKNNAAIRVILISFKAGNTGLNLTACNNVILVDLWWNPALEDQAFDRAHRFGQTRDVNIFKLKIDETVEERILMLQDKKRLLAQAALSGDKLKGMKLGMDDLLALFRRDDDDDDGGW